MKTETLGCQRVLRTSHGCFHGPKSLFAQWRCWLAQQIGIPLGMMEGYVNRYVTDEEVRAIEDELGAGVYREPLFSGICVLRAMENIEGIKWQTVKKDPLLILLDHSECGGRIRWWDAKPIALRLLQILRQFEDDTKANMPAGGTYDGLYPATKRFALGLYRAYKAREDVRWACEEICPKPVKKPATRDG